jgi:cytochrome c556
MRRIVINAALLIAVGFSAVGFAQAKIATAEDYQKVMKTAVAGFQGAFGALKTGSAPDAKTQLANARAAFMTLDAFWSRGKTPDAAMLMKDLLTNLDAADKALSAATPDTMAAMASLKMAQASCGTCHKTYREGDGKATPYSIKAGVI